MDFMKSAERWRSGGKPYTMARLLNYPDFSLGKVIKISLNW